MLPAQELFGLFFLALFVLLLTDVLFNGWRVAQKPARIIANIIAAICGVAFLNLIYYLALP